MGNCAALCGSRQPRVGWTWSLPSSRPAHPCPTQRPATVSGQAASGRPACAVRAHHGAAHPVRVERRDGLIRRPANRLLPESAGLRPRFPMTAELQLRGKTPRKPKMIAGGNVNAGIHSSGGISSKRRCAPARRYGSRTRATNGSMTALAMTRTTYAHDSPTRRPNQIVPSSTTPRAANVPPANPTSGFAGFAGSDVLQDPGPWSRTRCHPGEDGRLQCPHRRRFVPSRE